MQTTVTSRARNFKQPKGGYLGLKRFTKINTRDGSILVQEENIHPGLISMAVDYLTRVCLGKPPREAFRASLLGAFNLYPHGIDELQRSEQMADEVKGLDDRSIANACKLAGFDVAYRQGWSYYKPIDEINPNPETIYNVYVMVNRTLQILKDDGPVLLTGFEVSSQNAKYICRGDGDFVSERTLWDLKVSKNRPTTWHTLQLLTYYLMGRREGEHKDIFSGLQRLCILNPRLQMVYEISVDQIPEEVISAVEKDFIGF